MEILLIIYSTSISILFYVTVDKATKILQDKNEMIEKLQKENPTEKIIEQEKDFLEKLLENNILKRKVTKEESRSKYFENVEKGKKYEKFISEKYLDEGYQVDGRGERKGRKDLGIDILAKKDDIYFLIQCKNYASSSIIKQDIIRKFNGDCLNFVINNNLEMEKCKFLFIVPQIESLHNGTIKYFNENSNKCEFKILKMD